MTDRPSFIRRVDESGILLLVLRLFLGIYFVRTGIVKALDPVEFLKGVRMYGLLPESPAIYLNLTAVVLPWLEIVCGIALVLGTRIRGAAVQIGVMLVVFMPAISLRAMEMLQANPGLSFFDVQFDCGCGTGVEIIWIKLLKNTGLLVLALLILVARSRRFCLDRWFDRRRATPRYCRGCGYLLPAGSVDFCDACRERSACSAGTPDAVT